MCKIQYNQKKLHRVYYTFSPCSLVILQVNIREEKIKPQSNFYLKWIKDVGEDEVTKASAEAEVWRSDSAVDFHICNLEGERSNFHAHRNDEKKLFLLAFYLMFCKFWASEIFLLMELLWLDLDLKTN